MLDLLAEGLLLRGPFLFEGFLRFKERNVVLQVPVVHVADGQALVAVQRNFPVAAVIMGADVLLAIVAVRALGVLGGGVKGE